MTPAGEVNERGPIGKVFSNEKEKQQ